MMVIDSHVHIGEGSVWGSFSAENLLSIIGEEVDFAICSNLEGIDCSVLKEEKECNLKMLEITKKYSKIKPLYVCQPNKQLDASSARAILIQHKEFIGLKFHPECHKLPADNNAYDSYLELAQKLKKPCLYHSGHIKSRFSSPYLIYKKAREFKDVPIILGHLSTGPKQSHVEAINILLESIEKNNATLYVDISWIDFLGEELNETYEDTLMLIEKLRNCNQGDFTNRILWASDAPVGRFNQTKGSYCRNLEIFKQKVLEKFNDEQLLENLLSNNAKRLYSL